MLKDILNTSIAMLAVSLIVAIRARGDIQSNASGPEIWRVANRCGINSMYIVLRFHGKQVNYGDVERQLPVQAAGSSLADLRHCAIFFGLDANILHGTPEALKSCPLPAIAHCEEAKNVTGHYVVIMAMTRDAVQYIDGSTGTIALMPLSEFCQKWTGYVMTFQKRPWWHWLYPAVAALGATWIGLSLWIRHLDKKRSLL
jgi:predicted double-glycine peptidase